MCVHIFAPNGVVTISLLLEQIWLSPDAGTLQIEETYDIILRNESPDGEAIREFVVLYPHGLVDPAKPDRPGHVEVGQILQEGAGQLRENWCLREKPKWINRNQDILELAFYYDTPSTTRRFHCRRLLGRIEWPTGIADDAELVDLLRELKVGLFVIRLVRPLASGEEGVLRLHIRPPKDQLGIDSLPSELDRNGDDVRRRFSWDLDINSPEILRAATRSKFDRKEDTLQHALAKEGHTNTKITHRMTLLARLRDLCRSLLIVRGTSIRVERHILALIPVPGVDLQIISPEGNIFRIAPGSRMLDPSGKASDGTVSALLWKAGSEVNRATDLVYVMSSIRRAIENKDSQETTVADLCDDLNMTPEQRPAVDALVAEMKNAGVLVDEGDTGVYRWAYPDEDDPRFKASICSIRKTVDDLIWNRNLDDVPADERAVLFQFTNLHPFTVAYKTTWSVVDAALVRKKKLSFAGFVLWNLLLLALGIAGVVLGLLPLL